jgi:hypothetical protein
MAQDAIKPEIENGMGALPYTVIKITGINYTNPQVLSSGSGFFYSFREDDWEVHVIVTNKHVVEGLDKLSLHFGLMRDDGKRILGPAEIVSFEAGKYPIWRHPDPSVDIAVIPALSFLEHVQKSGRTPFFLSLSKENAPPAWLTERLIATTDIVMVGFPNGLMDEANNLPLVRKGILATPFSADHNGARNFVVDIAAFGGSSGSPVVAYFNGSAPMEDGFAIGQSAVYLLGILHSGPTVSSIGDVVTTPVPTSKQISHSKLMMHIGYCAKIDLLADFVPLIRAELRKK